MSASPNSVDNHSDSGRKGMRRLSRELIPAGGLALLTLSVAAIYVIQPQTPRELYDRAVLAVAPDSYGPNLRAGERLLERAGRARTAGADSVAESLEWRAIKALERAAERASEPRAAMAANDRLADTYLAIGERYLRRGRGRAFGLGRRPEALAVAERVAGCVVGIAPTRRRAEIDAFVKQLEEALDRPPAAECRS